MIQTEEPGIQAEMRPALEVAREIAAVMHEVRGRLRENATKIVSLAKNSEDPAFSKADANAIILTGGVIVNLREQEGSARDFIAEALTLKSDQEEGGGEGGDDGAPATAEINRQRAEMLGFRTKGNALMSQVLNDPAYLAAMRTAREDARQSVVLGRRAVEEQDELSRSLIKLERAHSQVMEVHEQTLLRGGVGMVLTTGISAGSNLKAKVDIATKVILPAEFRPENAPSVNIDPAAAPPPFIRGKG